MQYPAKKQYSIDDLLRIIEILRAPGGCPWDREQTHQSIRGNLIEETYEVADAIDRQSDALLCEELGDLMLQVALHVQMAKEAGAFTFNEVCDGICRKLIYRHPHVFGEVEVDGTGQVLQNWEALKNAEKHRDTAAARLDSVPQSLPALMRAAKVQKRAADYGFAYATKPAAFADLQSEVAELDGAVAEGAARTRAELGDVLFSAVNVARLHGIDAEEALGESTARFAARVKCCEALCEADGKQLEALAPAELDAYWKRAKQQED